MSEGLTVGTALTAQGLLGLVRAVRAEQGEAGKAPRMALVEAFAGLDFATGKKQFAEARKLAAEDNGGSNKSADATRLSEAHALFTAQRMAGMKPEDCEGMGWSPAVEFARKYLETAGLTVAGNPAKSDEQREADKAKREAATIKARAMDALPEQGEESDAEYATKIAAELQRARDARAAELSDKAVPETVVTLGKLLAETGPLFDALRAAAKAERKAWLALPADFREAIEVIEEALPIVINEAIAIGKVRKDASEQLKAQRKAEAELRAQQNQAHNMAKVG